MIIITENRQVKLALVLLGACMATQGVSEDKETLFTYYLVFSLFLNSILV